MGFIRGALLFIICGLLLLTIILGSVFYTIFLSLNYENVEKEIIFMFDDLTNKTFDFNLIDSDLNERINEIIVPMKKYCEEQKTVFENVEFANFSGASYILLYGEHSFFFSCDLVENYDSNENIEEISKILIREGASQLSADIYYSEYDCNFWNCFKETGKPFFLFSEKAKLYWKSNFYNCLLIFLILTLLVFLFVEQKQNLLIVLSFLVFISSFVLLKFGNFIAYFAEKYTAFIQIFFSRSYEVFWILLIFGIVLLFIWMLLRVLRWNFIKKKFSKKEVLEMIKKEVTKSKKEEKKNVIVKKKINSSKVKR